MSRTEGTAHRRRVVITGCGAITPLGLTTQQFWSALVAGRSGVGPITRFDASNLPVRIAGEVRDFDPSPYMPRTVSRRLDLFAQYALAAALQAVEDAKLDIGGDQIDPDRVGVYLGSAYGPVELTDHNREVLRLQGPRKVAAYFVAAGGIDNAAGEVALRLGARGPSAAMTTACATGATCTGEAMRLIQHGYADVMVVGGADESLNPLNVAAAANANALSRRNDAPTAASRPFDKNRDGFVVASGAGVLILEEAGHAVRRGAPVLAELVGYGATTDVYHVTAPHPEGRAARQAMRLALADADLEPGDVDYVNAHGTGTRLNDRIESEAIRAVLGEPATRIPISSIKSMTGHTLGAAGALELIATAHTVVTGTVPPTINCDDPEDTELDYVAHHARARPVRVALSNSFGFGGHNAVLVVSAWSEPDGERGTGGIHS